MIRNEAQLAGILNAYGRHSDEVLSLVRDEALGQGRDCENWRADARGRLFGSAGPRDAAGGDLWLWRPVPGHPTLIWASGVYHRPPGPMAVARPAGLRMFVLPVGSFEPTMEHYLSLRRAPAAGRLLREIEAEAVIRAVYGIDRRMLNDLCSHYMPTPVMSAMMTDAGYERSVIHRHLGEADASSMQAARRALLELGSDIPAFRRSSVLERKIIALASKDGLSYYVRSFAGELRSDTLFLRLAARRPEAIIATARHVLKGRFTAAENELLRAPWLIPEYWLTMLQLGYAARAGWRG